MHVTLKFQSWQNRLCQDSNLESPDSKSDTLSIRPQSHVAIYFCSSHNNLALTAYIKVACILLFDLLNPCWLVGSGVILMCWLRLNYNTYRLPWMFIKICNLNHTIPMKVLKLHECFTCELVFNVFNTYLLNTSIFSFI